MSITALFISAFLVGLSGAMAPGPLLTATIAASAQRGFIAGPLIVLGHALLELVLIIALLAGLSTLLSRASVTSLIGVAGGVFLLYLGFIMSRDAYKGKLSLEGLDGEKGKNGKGLHPVATGVLVSLSTPFWSLWWATVGLTYLTLSLESGRLGLFSFYTGHIMADLAWYSVVAAAVAGGRRFISERVYQYIMILCGLFLIGLGGYFIYYGIS